MFIHVNYLILGTRFLWGYNMRYVVVCVYECIVGMCVVKEKKEIGKFCTRWYRIRANITIVLCILTSISLYYKDSKTHLKPFYHSTKPTYNNTLLLSRLVHRRIYCLLCALDEEMKPFVDIQKAISLYLNFLVTNVPSNLFSFIEKLHVIELSRG